MRVEKKHKFTRQPKERSVNLRIALELSENKWRLIEDMIVDILEGNWIYAREGNIMAADDFKITHVDIGDFTAKENEAKRIFYG